MGNGKFDEDFKKYLEELPENFNILEDQIDINIQLEYFEYSKDNKEGFVDSEVLDIKDKIFDDEYPEEDKKILFCRLASIDSVEAYSQLEKYTKNSDRKLKEWSTFALQESVMLMRSSLLDESQVFISTGLGGKGKALRYFFVFLAKPGVKIIDVHHKIVRNELEINFNKFKGEIEKLEFYENFITIVALVPLKVPLRDTFKRIISDCNEFGNFLKPSFIVTNIKMLTTKEVQNYIDKKNNTLLET
jgi:hypothetical protein